VERKEELESWGVGDWVYKEMPPQLATANMPHLFYVTELYLKLS
jgi:hypothetical protein